MKKNGGTFGRGKVATVRSCVSSSVVFRIAEAILPHLVSFIAYTQCLLETTRMAAVSEKLPL
jgi:hypothetical protein